MASNVQAEPSDNFHSIKVTLDPAKGYVRPDNVKSGTFTFHGNVTVEKPRSGERVMVTMKSWVPLNWSMAVTPNTMYFEEAGTQGFRAEAFVPPATPMTLPEDNHVVPVSAYGSSPLWTGEASAMADLIVQQHFHVEAYGFMPPRLAKPGDDLTWDLSLWNHGNGPDTFLIEMIEGGEIFRREAFSDTISVDAFSNTDLSYSFTVREDIPPSQFGAFATATFRVRSLTAEAQGIHCEDTYTLSVRIDTLKEQVETVPPPIIALWAGLVTALTVVLIVIVRTMRRRSEAQRSKRHSSFDDLGPGRP